MRPKTNHSINVYVFHRLTISRSSPNHPAITIIINIIIDNIGSLLVVILQPSITVIITAIIRHPHEHHQNHQHHHHQHNHHHHHHHHHHRIINTNKHEPSARSSDLMIKLIKLKLKTKNDKLFWLIGVCLLVRLKAFDASQAEKNFGLCCEESSGLRIFSTHVMSCWLTRSLLEIRQIHRHYHHLPLTTNETMNSPSHSI